MHYKEHEIFTSPEDPTATIWRYMDFTKLVSLLETRSLFFARADKLGDAFEGSTPHQNVNEREALWPDFDDATARDFGNEVRRSRFRTFINCWNLYPYESAALWGLYVPQTGGVAIRSTFTRLLGAFVPGDEGESTDYEGVYIGRVNYADYQRDFIPEGNALWPFVYKRRSFEFEHELRAVVMGPSSRVSIVEAINEAFGAGPTGQSLPVNLDTLIDEVRVSPAAPAWFADLVQSVCRRYELHKPVTQSELGGDPIY